MKKLFLVIAFFGSLSSFGQNIIDANGDIIGNIDNTGVLKNGINQLEGEFLSNGNITNAENHIIGKIDGNQFKNTSGEVVGTIDQNNNVFDLNNSKIGSIQAGLIVIDANNHVFGRTSEAVDSKILAAYFFFFFNKGVL